MAKSTNQQFTSSAPSALALTSNGSYRRSITKKGSASSSRPRASSSSTTTSSNQHYDEEFTLKRSRSMPLRLSQQNASGKALFWFLPYPNRPPRPQIVKNNSNNHNSNNKSLSPRSVPETPYLYNQQEPMPRLLSIHSTSFDEDDDVTSDGTRSVNAVDTTTSTATHNHSNHNLQDGGVVDEENELQGLWLIDSEEDFGGDAAR